MAAVLTGNPDRSVINKRQYLVLAMWISCSLCGDLIAGLSQSITGNVKRYVARFKRSHFFESLLVATC